MPLKKVKRKKVKRKKVKRKKVKRKRKFGKSKPKSFDVRSFAKRNKVPLSVAATMLASTGAGAGYYYKTRSSKSSKMTGTENRTYSKDEIKKKLVKPIGSIIEENQKLKKMLHKVSKKYETCRNTIQGWRQGDTFGYYTDQYDKALKQIKLEDNDLEKKIREIEKEMKLIMTGKYVRFGKRKRKRKFGSTSDKRELDYYLNTNTTPWQGTKLISSYSSTWYSMPQNVRNLIWNICKEIAQSKKLDKSWKEITGAVVKIMLEKSNTITQSNEKLDNGTYAQNMNLLINFILSGKSKTPQNISTTNFKSNVQIISSFLTASLGEIGNKRSLTTDDIISIFCSGNNIKVTEKAKKQAEKILDNTF
jgi:hypothetical protein